MIVFLSYIREKKGDIVDPAGAGWDGSDPCTDRVNVGLWVTRERRGQRSKPRSRDTNGGSQRPFNAE